MKRFLALITALTLLCVLLTACTDGGNVSNDPNGSVSSNPADKQTDAASDLTPGTSSTNGSTGNSDNADIFDLPNGNGNGNGSNGTGGVNGNGNGNGVTGESSGTNGNGNGTNGNGTNGAENGVGVPQGRGMRRF